MKNSSFGNKIQTECNSMNWKNYFYFYWYEVAVWFIENIVLKRAFKTVAMKNARSHGNIQGQILKEAESGKFIKF